VSKKAPGNLKVPPNAQGKKGIRRLEETPKGKIFHVSSVARLPPTGEKGKKKKTREEKDEKISKDQKNEHFPFRRSDRSEGGRKKKNAKKKQPPPRPRA